MTTATLKKMFVVASLTGVLAGVILTLIQQIHVVPLILSAEVYEQAAELANQANQTTLAPEHDHGAWQPAEGWQRNVFTAAANVVTALGFALFLMAMIKLRGTNVNWRSGLLWGLGGYAVFFVAPSLGLPPEVPGTEAAELVHRQTWWVMTALFTAAGLAFITFSRRRVMTLFGVVVLLVPHLIGAPQPDLHSRTAPAELVQAFIITTAIANGLFWLSLGGLLGFFHQKVAN